MAKLEEALAFAVKFGYRYIDAGLLFSVQVASIKYRRAVYF